MQRTGSIAGGRRSDSGFSLLELMVVLVLIASIATLAMPRLGALVPGAMLDRAGAQVGGEMREAKAQAMRTGRDVTVVLDASTRSVGRRGRPIALPEDVRLILRGDVLRGSIVFYPDGSSSGGSVILRSDNRSRTIAVDWFDGEVLADARAAD